jgi:hypothetical protein
MTTGSYREELPGTGILGEMIESLGLDQEHR